MKKILTWIVLCNILFMGLNAILLFSSSANAAPSFQTGDQTTLESRIALLEGQYQALDARLRKIEVLLGIVLLEDSLSVVTTEPVAASAPNQTSTINNVPAQANSQLPKPSLLYRSNARYGPNTNYPIATNFAAGETVEIIGYNNDSGTIWYKLASGPWIAAFLVQNAPGSIFYIPAPSLDEIDNLNTSDTPVDAKSDPPVLPSASPERSSSSSIQRVPQLPVTVASVVSDDAPQDEAVAGAGGEENPQFGATSATSSSTSTASEASDVDSLLAPFDGSNSDGAVATAQITTQFDGTTAEAPQSETTQSELARQPIIRPAKPSLNCDDGCTEYPAWCDPPIKGHITFDANEKIYSVPGHVEYTNVYMDIEYGERWFCSVEEAVDAGWQAP